MWKDFVRLLGFMGRLPVKTEQAVSEEEWARSLRFLPVWGLIVGAIVAAVAYVVSWFSEPVAAACALAVYAALTGALHFDGVMDTADGLAAGNDREKAFRFMSDAHVGAMGVASLVVLLILKYALYLFLIQWGQVWWVIPAGLVFSRFALAFVVYNFPSAKRVGLAASFHKHFRGGYFVVALLIALILLIVFQNWLALLAAVFATLLVWCVGHSWSRRLGGLTGDMYGALTEWSEIIFMLLYFFALALATNVGPLLF